MRLNCALGRANTRERTWCFLSASLPSNWWRFRADSTAGAGIPARYTLRGFREELSPPLISPRGPREARQWISSGVAISRISLQDEGDGARAVFKEVSFCFFVLGFVTRFVLSFFFARQPFPPPLYSPRCLCPFFGVSISMRLRACEISAPLHAIWETIIPLTFRRGLAR